MIVLSEDTPQRSATPSAVENRRATEVARLLGLRVYYIPGDFEACENAENALAYVPEQEQATPGIWIGFIPDPERYQAIYDECLKKRIHLLNTPEQHLRAQEFDRAYPLLKDLTPESLVVTSPEEAETVALSLGMPVFVKGAVQSRKSRGWKACVAETPEELHALIRILLSLEGRTRGRVIVRKLVRLRHSQSSAEGFPFGREYRILLYRQRILGYGYYWEGDDPLMDLTPSEAETVLALAQEAARRVDVPFMAVDIGQQEDEKWIVIEVGDAQFAGYSRIPVLPLWAEIKKIAPV
jgi:hypothetical protein